MCTANNFIWLDLFANDCIRAESPIQTVAIKRLIFIAVKTFNHIVQTIKSPECIEKQRNRNGLMRWIVETMVKERKKKCTSRKKNGVIKDKRSLFNKQRIVTILMSHFTDDYCQQSATNSTKTVTFFLVEEMPQTTLWMFEREGATKQHPTTTAQKLTKHNMSDMKTNNRTKQKKNYYI